MKLKPTNLTQAAVIRRYTQVVLPRWWAVKMAKGGR